MTKGTFYYYFASKEQLLTQIHLQYIDYMLEEQRRIIEQPDRSWREKLSGIILMMIRAIEGQGGRARIFSVNSFILGATISRLSHRSGIGSG